MYSLVHVFVHYFFDVAAFNSLFTEKRISFSPSTCLFLLRTPLPPPLLKNFYHCATESVLTDRCTTVCKQLQWVIKMADWIVGSPLPHLGEIYSSPLVRQAAKIHNESSHSVQQPPLQQAQSHVTPHQQTQAQLLPRG